MHRLRALAVVLSVGLLLGLLALTWWLVEASIFLTTLAPRRTATIDVRPLVCIAVLAPTITVAICAWLYRARANLDAFAEARPKWGRGWAIGAWFIPLANLWIVPSVLDDVVRGSVPPGQRRDRVSGALRLWWGSSVAASFGQLCLGLCHGWLAPLSIGLLALVASSSQLYVVWQVTTVQERRFSGVPVEPEPSVFSAAVRRARIEGTATSRAHHQSANWADEDTTWDPERNR
jgi:hypothetical protein